MVVKLLLEKGAQPDFKNSTGWTPLSWAIEGGDVGVIHLLLANGAKVDCCYTIVSESHRS